MWRLCTELAVVTIAGGKVLEEPYVIRPTSETIVGPLLRTLDSELADLPCFSINGRT